MLHRFLAWLYNDASGCGFSIRYAQMLMPGVGDLILTCTGDLSRNRQVGLLVAQQHGLPDILNKLGHVAEGVYTVREVHTLAERLGVKMPISEAVYRILYENAPAREMATELLNRAPSQEFNL